MLADIEEPALMRTVPELEASKERAAFPQGVKLPDLKPGPADIEAFAVHLLNNAASQRADQSGRLRT
jgi:hypothetical protein